MKNLYIISISLVLFSITFFSTQAQINNPRDITYNWKTDMSKTNVDLSEITAVVPRNTFPQIDYPKFIEREEGQKTFYKHEPVISVAINGKAKAYSLNMLTMHEISNDLLAGIPILPTYCPLCNASVVYDRRLTHNSKEYLLEFEVSGMLRNSDMIMADNQTETWWQQLTGEGLVGELAGAGLEVIPSMVISVEEFFERRPNGEILSPNTGTRAENRYGMNPYEGYDGLSKKPYESFFDYKKLDSRLEPMDRVIDIEGSDGYKIYPFSMVANLGILHDTYDGNSIVIFHKEGTVSVLDKRQISKSRSVGSATVFSSILDDHLHFEKIDGAFIDEETQSEWDITGRCINGMLEGKELIPIPHSNHFAFAWLSFYPDSEIFR